MMLLALLLFAYLVMRIAKLLFIAHDEPNVPESGTIKFLQQFYDLDDAGRMALAKTLTIDGPARTPFERACTGSSHIQRAYDFQTALQAMDEDTFAMVHAALMSATFSRHYLALSSAPPVAAIKTESPEAVKTEAVKTEAVKTEAVKTEAVKTEAVEGVKAEAVEIAAVETLEAPFVEAKEETPAEVAVVKTGKTKRKREQK
jgi:hypothetical protein